MSGIVSVRELRQNLSVYLRRVEDGETLAVTSRGRRVAVLSPIGGSRRLDRLVAEGRATGPTAPWRDPLADAPLARGSVTVTDALLAERDADER